MFYLALDIIPLLKDQNALLTFSRARVYADSRDDPPVTTIDLQSKSLADARTDNSSEELIYRVSWERGKIPSRAR